jgi:hypothetical protein
MPHLATRSACNRLTDRLLSFRWGAPLKQMIAGRQMKSRYLERLLAGTG